MRFPTALLPLCLAMFVPSSGSAQSIGAYTPPVQWSERPVRFDLIHQRIALSVDWSHLSIQGQVQTTVVATTVTDTVRKLSICGSSGAPGWRTATRLDTALAAAANIPSLILRDRETMAPRTRPGYSMALFTWPTTYVTPL